LTTTALAERAMSLIEPKRIDRPSAITRDQSDTNPSGVVST
jgi:hypothetical protein